MIDVALVNLLASFVITVHTVVFNSCTVKQLYLNVFNNIIVIHHSPYIVDSRSDPISVGCTIFRVARRYFRVFFSYGASQAKSERRARWTACKDAAGRQTRRATSDHVAHYRRGVFRSLSVPNVFYSDVLLCLRNSRNNGLKCMRFTAI